MQGLTVARNVLKEYNSEDMAIKLLDNSWQTLSLFRQKIVALSDKYNAQTEEEKDEVDKILDRVIDNDDAGKRVRSKD